MLLILLDINFYEWIGFVKTLLISRGDPLGGNNKVFGYNSIIEGIKNVLIKCM